jgi:type III restriction enzyme
MADSSFRLLPFQEEAAHGLRTGALRWIAYSAQHGPPKYGATRIPFLGQLRAVTGSGKTPVLAETIGGLGDAVVLWTTRASAVVEQTFANLNGRYRGLLPPGAQIIRDVPSQAVWRELIDGSTGLTIWVLTVASWNEAEAETNGNARLRLRRPQPDWAGEGSPWEQLRDRLERPLWVVSDESHNQSAVQLDQLAALGPKGFFMASATPVVNDLFDTWAKALRSEEATHELLEASQVPISTRDVVEANLLKTTVELIDYRSGTEESLDGALEALRGVDEAAAAEGASIVPRAIYVVERSNPPRGSKDEARPVVIWRHLRSRGVSAREIAVFTDTRELPEDAERVTSISQLEPRHRHIIFNQSLQEGWDDPEAYVCYFDGATRSFLRIRQIVGRVLRQPSLRRYETEALNTATLIVQTPVETYDVVVSELRAELRLYAPDDAGFAPVRLKTRKEPLTPIPVKPQLVGTLQLPRYALRAPSMKPAERKLKATAERPWPQEALDAPGTGRKATVSLAEGSEELTYVDVLRSARTQNGAFLRRRILQRNRACLNAIHPDLFRGPAFEQWSCHGSQAQEDLTALGAEMVDYFEDRVDYQEDPDPDRSVWIVGEHRPGGQELLDFEHAAHPQYAAADFNKDELAFARELDRQRDLIWARNSATAALGFGIPLPTKVRDSATFYPDFLVWIGEICWAIDTTGRHLLDEKVRGKLITLGLPKMALVVRGRVDLGTGSREGKEGWSAVVGRPSLKPLVQHSDDLGALLGLLFHEEKSAAGV